MNAATSEACFDPVKRSFAERYRDFAVERCVTQPKFSKYLKKKIKFLTELPFPSELADGNGKFRRTTRPDSCPKVLANSVGNGKFRRTTRPDSCPKVPEGPTELIRRTPDIRRLPSPTPSARFPTVVSFCRNVSDGREIPSEPAGLRDFFLRSFSVGFSIEKSFF